MKTSTKKMAGKFALLTLMTISSGVVMAQVKIGANPTTIGSNSNIEIEATNGSKTVIQKSDGNMGIGTSTPSAKLHVDGNQILGQATSVASASGTSTVVRDNVSGELKVLKSTSTNSFAFTSVTYKINNVNFDWISNYDTKISSADYVVLVTGVIFSKQGLVASTSAGGTFAPLNFSAFTAGGTWRLSVDYDGGKTADNGNGNWTINCLVISKSTIQVLPDQTANLGGTSTGAAAGAPAGL